MTRKNTPARTILSLSALAAAAALAPTALAQTNITAAHKFAWQENCGWTNWRDAGSPVGTQGARIGATFLSGFVWGENIGWINLGDGTPAGGGGVGYANTDGADMGVNRDAGTGNLSGFAWGENVGRINFSGGALATPANPARFDAAAPGGGRLRGYAWGENIGWINLDDAIHYVGVLCPADFDGNGVREVSDIFAFLSAWFANAAAADFDGSGLPVAVPDIFAFLSAWFAGCP